ncbi:type VI secretion system baseplate subunit TssK [Zoogloea sp.]|uniref:type VI secretion system baseplate subunit TssK n=1 Tax=Zoogloea sp. TaxID=49181 RepID=UPI00261662AD|nr:type VI secretion system baseplate subunit TssK [uncultured Zoogloea sp.]
MSWYSKVVWSEGLFLRPQHFQQQDRHAEWYVEARSRAAAGLFWGFTQLEIDEAALATGKVALAAARGVLPDGTPFDFPATHPAPVALDIPPDTRNAVVYLALPLRRAQSPEAAPDGEPAAHLARYTPVEESLVDAAGSDGASEPIEVAHPRLVLALADQLSDAFVRVGVLRVVERRPDNNLLIDKAYIPPVLACRASPVLGGFLREIRGLLGQRGDALAARLAQPGAGGVAEIADFIFLLTVNRHQPVFDHLAELTQLHPERLFSQLLALSGELATLVGSERRPAPLPAYNHDALEACFAPLIRDIRRALATVLEQNAIQIELQDHKQGRFVGLVGDRSLLRHAGFVLAVNAQVPSETLRTRFPAQAKLGPVEKIRELVNLQLPGIALRPLPVAPRQIPFHAGFSYFELDNGGELWKQLDNSGGLGIYVTGDFPALELSLWAIRA